MPVTDTSEKGLESLIMRHMTGSDGLAPSPGVASEQPLAYGGTGWLAGDAANYDRANALDPVQVFAFLQATQLDEFKKIGIVNLKDPKDFARLKFLNRLSSEIGKRGVIDVLRNGIKDGPHSFELFYGTPSPGNQKAVELFGKNRFSVTRQLRYSLDETQNALDLCLFINGLPIATFELKNSLTKQTVDDAIKQYRLDRDPRETLFQFKRCIVHLAVDDTEVQMCTRLEGKASRLKAEIMADHFHEQVIALNKIGGQARAMVVCNGIERAIQYYFAIKSYLVERKSPYQAIVAFSGEPEFNGQKVTESSLNGFPANEIADKIQEDPYRFLICADKFQTGYDEPLLHTMYVDKPLAGIKAVQTLSRLNRAHPQKHDVFVLDFINNSETIREAFSDYYRTTILSEETDPNKLHDLKAALDAHQVYSPEQIETLVERYLAGAERDKLDEILDVSQDRYMTQLNEDGQIEFKGKVKAFTRTYDFLASVLPYTNADLVSSFASTRDQKCLDQLEGVRRMRRSAMARLLPQDAEAETWCICKHFLSGSMRMQETGSKLLAEGDRSGAGNCFEIASAMKDRALQVAANSGSGAQCNVCKGG